jgi:(R)-2-hydroxyacyl-CoA dehydratese activating ATPase
VLFRSNDKCAAGTGKFLELMAGTLGLDIDELCIQAAKGSGTTISSMCTVFAESEVISLIGSGKRREDIAFGVIESITGKVKSLCQKHSDPFNYFLTGGLCDCPYIVKRLSEKLGSPVVTQKMARYAGYIGAAIMASRI